MMHYEDSELPLEIEKTIVQLETRYRQVAINAFVAGAVVALVVIAVISILILLFQ